MVGSVAVSILARPSGRAQPTDKERGHQAMTTFQSSPVHQDGRNRVQRADAPVGFLVSILARPSGRAQPPLTRGNTITFWAFQSSPVHQDGRNTVRQEPTYRPPTGFNPRPSIRTGATDAPQPASSSSPRFNPRPSIRTGATQNAGAGGRNRAMFQSSPVHQDGRNIDQGGAGVGCGRVSILARPSGRAQLRPLPAIADTVDSFQSSPVHQDGRNALRRRLPAGGLTSFNPRPSIRTGATSTRRVCGTCSPKFQSSPVHQDGRNRRARLLPADRRMGFNPRPSIRTGATSQPPDMIARSHEVSILARPSGRAQLTSTSAVSSSCSEFQSSPVHQDGRNRP